MELTGIVVFGERRRESGKALFLGGFEDVGRSVNSYENSNLVKDDMSS